MTGAEITDDYRQKKGSQPVLNGRLSGIEQTEGNHRVSQQKRYGI